MKPIFLERSQTRSRKKKWHYFKHISTIVFLVLIIVFTRREILSTTAQENIESLPNPVETLKERIADESTVLEEPAPDLGPKIVIDCGHGGEDTGCQREGISEKDLNLAIGLKVAAYLEELGYTAILTRSADTALTPEERVEIANASNAQLFVSIHQNADENVEAYGVETWFDSNDLTRDNLTPALYIQDSISKIANVRDRGLRTEGSLIVTSRTTMPACLVETGFLSNKLERDKLVNEAYQQELAKAIAEGIKNYFVWVGEKGSAAAEPKKELEKTMYLTFDDGPSKKTTPLVLDTLKKHNIKATFFLVGENVEKYPDIARRIAMEGHAIGVHCNRHVYKEVYRSVASYVEDFKTASDTIEHITGVRPKIFRFPGGSVNDFNKKTRDGIIDEMTKNGYVYYDWNCSLEDAVKGFTPESLLRNAAETAKGRSRVVLLAHDTVLTTAEILERLLEQFSDYKMEVLTAEVEPVQFRRK